MALKQHHFVLVHGAGHATWCWERVTPLLEKAGHRVTTLDLASAGENPTVKAEDVTSFKQYNQPLEDLFQSFPDDEKVILVGHSLGGMSLTYTSEMFPKKVSVAIYLAAFMPAPGLNLYELLDLAIALARCTPYPAHRVLFQAIQGTKENYGSVPRIYVLALHDKIILPSTQRKFIEWSPPNEVIEIDADHSVFYSATDEVVKILIDGAAKYDS